ncbi:MAG: glycosyltransferase family 2 protein [Chloroflexota bacterium]
MPTQPTIAAAVIARNEANNIGPCLERLGWADEVLVLDSCSTDDTVARALAHTPDVHRRPFDDFAHQRNAALSLLRSDWVLFVDADERVSPELAAEARTAVAAAEAGWAPGDRALVTGFWVPRRNIILGRWIRGGGWYPDHQLRLLKVGRARYDETRKVHEVVLLDGEQGRLQQPFVHYNYQRLGQLFAKQAAYAALEAVSLYDRGVPGRPHSIVLQTLREFSRRYFTLGGWRDGGHGVLLCGVVAFYTGVAYAKLWRLRRADRGTHPSPTKS